MANQDQKKPQKPQEQREAQPERESERQPARPQESHDGMPGYGQPPDEVRTGKLPNQKW
ncbi:hypothetical protein [Cystobacter fuscus]|uniref:hypothetical protein n=1 Tax=Cystobacter fuscus TaxID=43 RepID=UPI0037C113FE